MFNKKAKESEKSTNGLDSAFKSLSPSTLAAVAGVTALIGALKGLAGFGKNIVDMASHFETVQTELGTVLQSAEKGKELFEDLRKFSFETTFGVDELADASTQLLNVGKSTKDLQKDLKMLGDLAGGNKNKFAELTNIFAKVIAQGKATSMQLQQINLRGIPITKTLQEMGIKGTASAEQLTEAFKKLTGEGGQFHNAMSNIIDTIEGKRGFISDTLKEIYVNFGEVSGITDSYKSMLDTLYGFLNKLNNALMVINENPILKAIIRGLLAGAIVGIITLLGQTLIPLLATKLLPLLAKIGAVAAANPFFLIAAGVTALVTAMAPLVKKSNEAYKEAIGLKKVYEDIDALKEKNGVGDVDIKAARKDVKEHVFADNKNKVAVAIDDLEKAQVKLTKLQAKYKEEMANPFRDYDLTYLEAEITQAQKLVELRQQELEKAELVLNAEKSIEERRARAIEEAEAQIKAFEQAKQSADEYFLDTNEGKLVDALKQANELQKMINSHGTTVKLADGSTYDIKFNSEQLKGMYNRLDRINDSVKQLETAVIAEGANAMLTDYQKWVMSTLGMTIEDAIKQGYVKYHKNNEGQIVVDKVSIGTQSIVDTVVKANKDYFEKLDLFTGQKDAMGKYAKSEVSYYQSQLDIQQKTLEQLTAKASKTETDLYTKDEKTGKMVKYADAGKLDINNEAVKNLILAIEETEKALSKSKIEELKKSNNELAELIKKEGSVTEALKKQQALAEGITEEQLEQYYAEKKRSELNEELQEARDLSTVANNLKAMGKRDDNLGMYLGGSTLSAMSSLGSNDYSTIINGIIDDTKGFKAILGDLVENGLTKLLGSIDSIEIVLNPIADAFVKLAPVVKTILIALIPIAEVLGYFFDAIMSFLNWLTGGFFDEMNDLWDEYAQSAENAKKTTEELAKEQENLLMAMKKQEEYYLSMKKQINSDSYRDSVYSVNDMILTPNGKFSTSPEDTIIAMKKPEQLMNNSVMSVKIINNANVDVSARQNGDNEMLVTISQKVASDYAYGLNGWDNAIEQQRLVQNGRSR